jgi:hypothetical protein
MIKSLTEQCSIEELRIQTLQGTIRHKMSEYPIVSARMSEIDHQAIDLYNTLMDSQPVPVDTSPTFRPFDLPSPSSVEAESDIDGYVASRGSDATRASAVRPSAPALLNDFTVHLEKAEQEVKESKMNMLEREEKLRKAGAVLGRDQEIVSRTHQVNSLRWTFSQPDRHRLRSWKDESSSASTISLQSELDNRCRTVCLRHAGNIQLFFLSC